jgi:guanylate kinase
VKDMKKKLVVLSGPSCVGKGPLRRALRKYHPEIKFAELVLCNSRKPRLRGDASTYEVHGIDFYFLPRSLFEQIDRSRFIVANVRSDIQAIDMMQVRELLEGDDLVLAEVFHTLGRSLMEWAKSQTELDLEVRSVFLLPLSSEEIGEMVRKTNKTPEQVVYEVMKAKLERRGEDPPHKIEERAHSAYLEMQDAPYYSNCIVNHAGEDDRKEWDDPLGPEAQRVLNEFVKVLQS